MCSRTVTCWVVKCSRAEIEKYPVPQIASLVLTYVNKEAFDYSLFHPGSSLILFRIPACATLYDNTTPSIAKNLKPVASSAYVLPLANGRKLCNLTLCSRRSIVEIYIDLQLPLNIFRPDHHFSTSTASSVTYYMIPLIYCVIYPLPHLSW